MPVAYSYIRWSSAKQTDGDSLRRQTKSAAEYAAKHGLQLADNTYLDSAMSAKDGKNVQRGALGAFLAAVDDHKIAPGSYLLVDNIDRLSRMEPRKVIRLLQDIVDRGITLVTLTDGKRYSNESLDANWTDFIILIAGAARAHEENKNKGRLVKAAWDAKRASGKPMTKMTPGWITLSDGKFIIDEAKAAVVRRVFELSLEGNGYGHIMRVLNQENVPTLKYGVPWTEVAIGNLLKNEAVIGHLRSAHTGEVSEGYYRPIIPTDLFYKVQLAIEKRAEVGRGRRGVAGKINNLFAGIAYCELCGSPMRFLNKGNHQYLMCRRSHEFGDCDHHRAPYNALEEDFMRWFVAWKFVPSERGAPQLDQRDAIRAELADAESRLEKTVEALGVAPNSKAIAKQVEKLEAKVADLEERLRSYVPKPTIVERLDRARQTWLDYLKLDEDSEERRAMRLRMQTALRECFSKIVVLDAQHEAVEDDEEAEDFGKAYFYREVEVHGDWVDAMVEEQGGVPKVPYRLPKQGVGGSPVRRRKR